jgi:amino acid permease
VEKGDAMKKKLTVWEAACVITGYGIGAGVLAVPAITARNGVIVSAILLAVSFAASLLMHTIVADLSLRAEGQVNTLLAKLLFKGPLKNVLTIVFFLFIAFVLVTTLATFITGAGDDIISTYLAVPPIVGRLIFYVFAAAVVLFGLKAVGVSEKIAVVVIFAILGVLMVASAFFARNPLPVEPGTLTDGLQYYGVAMFCFVAFFSVPQAVEGLDRDVKKIKKAILIGFTNILVMIVIVTVSSLLVSHEMTAVATIGWSEGIGPWAQVLGVGFTLLAMLTTYWSISLALADIIQDQLHWPQRVCWLLATLPTLLFTFLPLGGFTDFMRLAAGLSAILLAALIIPAQRSMAKIEPSRLLGKFDKWPVHVIVIVTYVFMAVGNLI